MQNYPSILRRYLSTLIDGLLILLIFILSFTLIDGKNQEISIIRFCLPFVIALIYEPILTSKACTIGQLATGIRVRKVDNLNKISFFSGIIRYLIKLLLGFISFFSIIFSDKCRAIHDYASGTIVINKSDLL